MYLNPQLIKYRRMKQGKKKDITKLVLVNPS